MPISQTTFEERLARINAGQANNVPAKNSKKDKRGRQGRSLGARMMTFPCLLGIGILSGGTAYAWVATEQRLPDMMAKAQGMVVTNVQWVMAFGG